MSNLNSFSVPTTPAELDQAINRYRATDPSDNNLYSLWEAIRSAALQQTGVEMPNDQVSGEASF